MRRPTKGEHRKATLGLLAGFVLHFVSAPAPAQTFTRKEVLLLNSYRPGFAWTDEVVRGVRSALANEPYEVEFWVEYIDAARYSGPEYLDELQRLYRHKYGRKKIDLIVSSDDEALDFLLSPRAELFANTPVVFCGVNNPKLASQAPRHRFTGVLEVFDNREILDLALKLHPGTHEIYVVSGSIPTAVSVREA